MQGNIEQFQLETTKDILIFWFDKSSSFENITTINLYGWMAGILLQYIGISVVINEACGV